MQLLHLPQGSHRVSCPTTMLQGPGRSGWRSHINLTKLTDSRLWLQSWSVKGLQYIHRFHLFFLVRLLDWGKCQARGITSVLDLDERKRKKEREGGKVLIAFIRTSKWTRGRRKGESGVKLRRSAACLLHEGILIVCSRWEVNCTGRAIVPSPPTRAAFFRTDKAK